MRYLGLGILVLMTITAAVLWLVVSWLFIHEWFPGWIGRENATLLWAFIGGMLAGANLVGFWAFPKIYPNVYGRHSEQNRRADEAVAALKRWERATSVISGEVLGPDHVRLVAQRRGEPRQRLR